jgi:hypothetical protein
MCTSSRTMQPSGSSSRVRSCHQTRCHQLVEDSRKPRPSGKATSSTQWRSTGMKPSPSCQSTGVPTRHGSESKGAPPVGSVIRTNGATSRLMPPTVDTAAHTAERLARNVNSTVSRIAPSLAASDGELSNQCTQFARSGAPALAGIGARTPGSLGRRVSGRRRRRRWRRCRWRGGRSTRIHYGPPACGGGPGAGAATPQPIDEELDARPAPRGKDVPIGARELEVGRRGAVAMLLRRRTISSR